MQLSVFDRVFDKVMGLASDGADRLWIATRFEIWRFENVLGPGQRTADGHDRLFVPRHSSVVGDLNIHDLGLQADGRDLWVNTRYNCLASASDTSSFVPRWHPPFLAGPQAGDCCHLNGLAMVDGLPGYVTCVSRSAEVDGWRDGRRDQGVVIDVASREVVVDGLSMPHSPRWHDGSLWLANAGTGELGRVDLERGSFEPVVFGPGFLRGLCFVGDYAVVGSSKPRRGDIYSGLALDDALEQQNLQPHLGLFVVDLRRGELVEWLLIEGAVRELFDVCALGDVQRPGRHRVADGRDPDRVVVRRGASPCPERRHRDPEHLNGGRRADPASSRAALLPRAARVAGGRGGLVGRRGGRAPRRGERGTDHRRHRRGRPRRRRRAAWKDDSLWVFDRWQLWRFVDALAGAADGALRRLLLPQRRAHGGTRRRLRPGDDVDGTPPRLVAVRLPGCAR